MGFENPPLDIVPSVIDMDEPAGQGDVTGGGLVNPNPEIGAEIVKFVFEISKKTFPIASTLILAVVESTAGTTTSSVPSFAVLASNTVGKVSPPSVDKDIFTGGRLVLFTDHVTVWVEFPGQFTFVFGCVTAKGPAVLVIVRVISAN
jgi:hypothetical protein